MTQIVAFGGAGGMVVLVGVVLIGSVNRVLSMTLSRAGFGFDGKDATGKE